MPRIAFAGPRFYSAADEAAFFAWLQKIVGISRVRGEGGMLLVTVSARISESSLRELLALHQRYKLPMRHLALLASPSNERWFKAPGTYWHGKVFGGP